jgi:P-type conjugative transfer protein TrbJ
MTTTSAVAAAAAASRPRVPESPGHAACLFHAAQLLLPDLERGQRIDATMLRTKIERACGGGDAEGAWDWKSAYDACEVAVVLFLRRFGGAMAARAGSRAALVPMLAKVAGLLPAHTRRSAESETFQQFSTPLPLAFVAATAAALAPADRVLEPSAGTGLLAILAELAGASLALNELAGTRAGLLSHLFPDVGVTGFDAARIDDHLDAGVTPTVVLMNPPFSALANVDRRRTDAALRHVSSALARLAEGGRLVAITQASLAPDSPAWREDFQRLQERGTVVFSAAIDGAVYARHGTTIETRLIVIDKRPASDPTAFPASPGTAPDAATLLRWVVESVPPRLPVASTLTSTAPMPTRRMATRRAGRRSAWVPAKASAPTSAVDSETVELSYETVDWKPAEGGRLGEGLYEDYALQSILLSAARALEQINNQVRLLQGQAQMLLKMDQNLLRLGSTMSPDLLGSLSGIQAQLRAGEGIALQLRATESAYERLFPKQVSAALASDDVLRNAKSRWEEQYAALHRAALLQGQIADGIDADTHLLGDAMARSRGAAGALEVAQAGNELTALSVKQSLALQSLLAAQYRADTIAKAREIASEEEGKQRFKTFLGNGQAYTARK